MVIQDATADDLPAILAIYNDAVLNTTAIWNETQVGLANRQAWLSERNTAGFPVLVRGRRLQQLRHLARHRRLSPYRRALGVCT
jgi:phosphinothricin acetyltransferase